MRATVLWSVAGVLALLLAGGVGYGVSRMMIASAQPAGAAGIGGNLPHSSLPAGPVVSLPKFVTNLSESGTAIDVTFALVLTREEDVATVETHKLLLRDQILGVIRSKKAADVQALAGKEGLAADVLAAVQEVLGPEVVRQVLVTDMVTQP